MKWILYNAIFGVVYPFLLPGFLSRMFRRGGYRARMGDRFALYPQDILHKLQSHDGWIWIHAVSVGEVQVAGQLMREWRRQSPGVRFCFSTTSSTGWKMAEREVADGDVLIYNPLDFPSWVKSALKIVRPRAIVLTESEIWPNFIMCARHRAIPLYLINARISDRSAPRYRLARWFFGEVLNSFRRIFVQSKLDRERFLRAGTKEEKLETTGSFKFDVARRNPEKEREMRDWIGEGAILLGGSTWPGEDEMLLGVYKEAKTKVPSLKLVIAPRHFEKADAVEENIAKSGFTCARRSKGTEGEVCLADTTGELMGLYGIADVVFVGKSLCAHGSQNMIEPCLCGKPTVVGPWTENFRPVMSDLLDGNGILQGADEAETKKMILDLMCAPDAAKELGERAAAAVARRKGVVPRVVKEILEDLR